jgi:hypothetical protein
VAAVLVSTYVVLGLQPAAANHIAYSKGDVFAAVGNGKIDHYSATGTLLEVLDTGTGATNPPANETGMCFDPTGKLFATDYDAFDMAKFNNLGGLISHPFGPNFLSPPETCVVDQAGQNIYVGTGELSNDLFKLDTNGNVLDTFFLVRDQGGINWIDLNPKNQCQLYYTSEGTRVKRFDVCTHTQLSDFASGLPPGNAGCFGLRIRSNGEVLVACDQQIVQLNSSGSIIKSYNPGSESDFFALALDPDGASFWAAGYTSGHLYKVNIASGSVGTNFVAAPATDAGLAGLAVFGDDAVDPGYPRPKGATPLLASLVLAYERCTSPNRQHGAPLASQSCSPPRQSSGFLTVGTPDANGQLANSVGSVRFVAQPGNSTTPADEADVGISVSITDVRKTSNLSDYTGELQAASRLEITDRYNSAEPATQPFNDAGTAVQVSLPVAVPCVATADTTVGSNCAITTTADAVVAGSVMESKRTIWQMDQVQVFDGGSDGLASTAGNTLFVDQGVFVP